MGVTPLTRAGYDIDIGTSYAQVVAFEAGGPVARAILTYGQSSRPGSPRAFDQLSAFAARQWYPLPYRAADVVADRLGEPLTLRFRPSRPDADVPGIAAANTTQSTSSGQPNWAF
jgi:acyl-homoserine-lactone acylase